MPLYSLLPGHSFKWTLVVIVRSLSMSPEQKYRIICKILLLTWSVTIGIPWFLFNISRVWVFPDVIRFTIPCLFPTYSFVLFLCSPCVFLGWSYFLCPWRVVFLCIVFWFFGSEPHFKIFCLGILAHFGWGFAAFLTSCLGSTHTLGIQHPCISFAFRHLPALMVVRFPLWQPSFALPFMFPHFSFFSLIPSIIPL